ncbi:MAG: hypothetical protein JSW11_16330 [Candidatus Heimdallarchaeota archaeon]|nr:MAG: hypothetical protein JSW11_16330 [Candidatus Heimdallarchaeota archaeon]
MQNDVIFSVFDRKKGPVILYSSLDSPDSSKRVAVRSFIAIGAMEEQADLSGKHAVVPLPALNKIAFYYMFKVDRKEKSDESPLWATIGYMNESTESIDFYRTLPIIQENIQKIVELIQLNFSYSDQDNTLNRVIIESISSLQTLQEETVKPTPIYEPPGTVPQESVTGITFEDFKVGDLSFLFEYFPEDLDKVIYALLLEEPVLIIGDIRDIVQKVVASLEYLVPHRLLTKKYLTNYIDPKGSDILICSSHVNFLKKYKNFVNVNVDKRKVDSKIKGVPSINDLINTLQIAPKETQTTLIKTYVDKLLAKAAELMELCEPEQISKEEIRSFRGDLKGDELNVVIALVRKYAPQFEDKLFYFARSLI